MPSRTKSSSRSKSKRSKKQKPYNEKSVARDGINFFAMMFGMVTACLLILLCFNAFSSPPLNEEFAKADAANIGAVASTIDTQDFAYIVANSDTDKLIEILTGLTGFKKSTKVQSQVTNSKRTLLVSNHLLGQPLTRGQRDLAVLSKLTAAAKVFWLDRKHKLGEPDMSSTLRDMANQYAEDTNQEIAFLARAQLLRLDSLDAAENVASHGNELLKFLRDFPEDKRAHLQIFGSLQHQLVNPKTRHVTEKLANLILSQPRVPGNENTAAFYSRVSDLWNLCDRNFFDIQENQEIGGNDATEQLHKVCLELLQIPTAGNEIMGHVVNSARLLESTNKYDHAKDIYRAIAKLDSNLKTRTVSAFGIKRVEAVGKPLELAGTRIDGSQLADADFDNMPVIILYWRAGDPKSNKALLDLEAVLARWRPDSIKVVAPCVGMPKDFEFEKLKPVAENYSKWWICRINADQTYPLFDQLPSLKYPRIVLLDRNHNVVDVEIPVDELLSEIKSLFARSRAKK